MEREKALSPGRGGGVGEGEKERQTGERREVRERERALNCVYDANCNIYEKAAPIPQKCGFRRGMMSRSVHPADTGDWFIYTMFVKTQRERGGEGRREVNDSYCISMDTYIDRDT